MARTALIIGASRGLGWGLARELIRENWCVVGTVRDVTSPSPLHELQAENRRNVDIERADITQPQDLIELRVRLAGRRFDLLFVVAGISNDIHETIGEVSTEEFVRVMVTNTLGPLRAVETLIDLVTPKGQVAVMSSELGSIADNTDGGWDVYRASKASLNTLMRCLVARRVTEARTFYARPRAGSEPISAARMRRSTLRRACAAYWPRCGHGSAHEGSCSSTIAMSCCHGEVCPRSLDAIGSRIFRLTGARALRRSSLACSRAPPASRRWCV